MGEALAANEGQGSAEVVFTTLDMRYCTPVFFSTVEIILAQTSLKTYGTSHFRSSYVTVLRT